MLKSGYNFELNVLFIFFILYVGFVLFISFLNSLIKFLSLKNLCGFSDKRGLEDEEMSGFRFVTSEERAGVRSVPDDS